MFRLMRRFRIGEMLRARDHTSRTRAHRNRGGVGALVILSVVVSAGAPRAFGQLVNPGFDSEPPGYNAVDISTIVYPLTAGAWGVENASVVGPTYTSPVQPPYMLQMLNSGGVLTEAWQFVNVGAGSGRTADLSAYFTAFQPNAIGFVDLIFYADPNDWGNQISDVSTTGTCGPGGNWRNIALSNVPVPPATTWIGVHLGFNNASIGNQPGSVDAVQFSITQSLDAFGLLHTSLGAAQLSLDPNGNLIVSNLGNSGQDGVQVRVGTPAYTEIDLPDVATMPDGASRAILSVGIVNGVPEMPVGTINVSRAGAEWNVTPDFSPLGNVQFQYQVWNQGHFVGVLPGSSGLVISGAVTSFSGGQGGPAESANYDCGCGWGKTCLYLLPNEITYVWSYVRQAGWEWVGCGGGHGYWNVFLDGSQYIGQTSDDSLIGDEIEIVLVNASPIDAVTAFEIRTLGTPMLKISAEAVGLSGLPVQATGGATLTASEPGAVPQIEVSNVGPSGRSGISVDLPPTSRAALTIAPLDPNSMPDGAHVECAAIGTVNGVPDQVVSIVVVWSSGNSIYVERAAQTDETQRIRVFLHDQLVADVPHHTGPAASLSEWPVEYIGVGQGGSDDDNGSGVGLSHPIVISIIGGPTVAGDRLVINSELANDGAALTQVQLVGANFPGFALTGIAVPPAPYFEPFEEYATGSQMHDQGGWHGWDGNAAAGALVSAAHAHSAPNSVAIAAASDLVREFGAVEGGLWKFSAWQYVPGDFQSNCNGNICGSYCLLMNTYQDQGPYNWSVELRADSTTNSFIRDGNTPASLPLIRDAWTEIKVLVDLDDDSYRVFYGGTELGTAGPWTQGIYGEGGGLLRLQALGLFANGSTPVYYDDVSLAQVPQGLRGDMNCDGIVDFDDINPFVLALTGQAPYEAAFPNCKWLNADCNGDGVVNFGDINPFVALLSN